MPDGDFLMQRFLVGSQDTSHSPIIPVLGYSSKPPEGHDAQALEHPETRTEASEGLRGLIDAIVLTPNQGELPIELKGNLARCWGRPKMRRGRQKRATSRCKL